MRLGTRTALAAAVLCSSWAAHADPGDDGTPCPMSPTQDEARLVRERMAIGMYDAPAHRGGPDILVPLTIHVVRRSDGTGGLSPAQGPRFNFLHRPDPTGTVRRSAFSGAEGGRG